MALEVMVGFLSIRQSVSRRVVKLAVPHYCRTGYLWPKIGTNAIISLR